MLHILTQRRGRKAAVDAIGPFMAASRVRLNGIPDSAFTSPYMVGFLSALITVCAKRARPSIKSHDLALVQGDAWARLTGMSGDLFGEEICYLSATRHADFVLGCRNALTFGAALYGSAPDEELLASWATVPLTDIEDHFEPSGVDATDLWQRYFEERIVAEGTDPASDDWA